MQKPAWGQWDPAQMLARLSMFHGLLELSQPEFAASMLKAVLSAWSQWVQARTHHNAYLLYFMSEPSFLVLPLKRQLQLLCLVPSASSTTLNIIDHSFWEWWHRMVLCLAFSFKSFGVCKTKNQGHCAANAPWPIFFLCLVKKRYLVVHWWYAKTLQLLKP